MAYFRQDFFFSIGVCQFYLKSKEFLNQYCKRNWNNYPCSKNLNYSILSLSQIKIVKIVISEKKIYCNIHNNTSTKKRKKKLSKTVSINYICRKKICIEKVYLNEKKVYYLIYHNLIVIDEIIFLIIVVDNKLSNEKYQIETSAI